ncbi:uncharacterized protein [Ptychodera flava]|uniref:uncharacterized protein n=1 Tax=Ptychodera flava TaxID=63121 RepID=UPI00396A780A
MNGEVVGSKLSQSTKRNFEMMSDMNEHTYRPNDSNYWSITVSRNSNAAKSCEDLLGNMSFYKGEGSKLLAELPFLSRGKKSTREAPTEINVDTREPGSSGQASTDLEPLSVLFSKLRDELRAEDTSEMVQLLTSKQISPRYAEKLKDPYEVFRHLHSCYGESDTLTLLKNVFTEMGRRPLVKSIDDFLQKNETK